MLFRCHQMSMEREAKLKRQQQQQQQQQLLLQQQQNNNNTCIKGFLNQNVPIVWVLGGPGSGKGTQCAKIIAKYKFTHLSTGDLLRDAVAKGSEKGKEIQEIMSTGKLVPNELVLDLLVAAIASAGNESKGFLIDGYPREKSQGAEFEKKIGPADLIIYLECAEETMVKRVLIRAAQSKEVRADDNETTIKERIAVFAKNTNLILEQYPNNTLRINAERDIDDIFNEIDTILESVIVAKNDSQISASVAQ